MNAADSFAVLADFHVVGGYTDNGQVRDLLGDLDSCVGQQLGVQVKLLDQLAVIRLGLAGSVLEVLYAIAQLGQDGLVTAVATDVQLHLLYALVEALHGRFGAAVPVSLTQLKVRDVEDCGPTMTACDGARLAWLFAYPAEQFQQA